MEEKLYKLWLNIKEVKVFLYLIEYWISPASEIGNNICIPKSTVNFLADNLWRRWILKKSFRWWTWFFEVDILNFEKNLLDDISEKQNILKEILPLLRQKNKNIISKPKIIFIDSLENCKKQYLEILNIKWTFYEFWAHKDLEEAFWKKFMQNFINKRIEKNIFCDSIWSTWKVEKSLQFLDEVQNRNLKIFDKDIFWNISSSIAIYEDKVLILNLIWNPNWILIENKNLSETMKTIFLISRR